MTFWIVTEESGNLFETTSGNMVTALVGEDIKFITTFA
jgi:hypothetical protein